MTGWHIRQHPRHCVPPPHTSIPPQLVDAARGIFYLHSMKPPIIHRDIKSPNLVGACVPASGGASACDGEGVAASELWQISSLNPACCC